MKMKFNNIFGSRSVVVGLLLAIWLCSSVVQGQVYFTVQQLLSEQFRASEQVTFRKVNVTDHLRYRIEHELGVKLPKAQYTVYVATSRGKIDGYALFDEERGQHEMIGLATFFDAKGTVTRVEITAFREPHGDGVRAEQFRRQFVGRNAHSGFSPDKDIDAISGATISSRSLCKGVRRATALVQTAVLEDPELAQR
jgi:Na+-translocating ferredoxin:NAD+ oxidoreductase RnfG subunit